MRLELTGRHVQITPELRSLVDEKLVKLERFLNHRALSAQAVLTHQRHLNRTDVTLHARGEKFLHCCAVAGTWEASVSEAFEKLAQQAQKVKGKWQGRKRRSAGKAAIAAEPREMVAGRPMKAAPPTAGRPHMPRIMRASRQALKAMSVADAARQIDVDRDGVIVFRDAETSSISVLYRRPDGELALVETEA